MSDTPSPGGRPGRPTGGARSTDRIVVVVRVRPDEVELAADELFTLGASAVSEVPVVAPADPGGDPADRVDLVADLPADRVAELGRAHRLGSPEGVAPATSAEGGSTAGRPLHDPVHVAGFVLVPVAEEGPDTSGVGTSVANPADPGRTVLLDPHAAFGSGTHETTRLCVTQVVRLVRPGSRVVDVGSGNGVLSVVAARCGAAAVVAIDVDPAARAATSVAARRNAVSDRVVVVDSTVDELAAVLSSDAAPGATPHAGWSAPGADLVLANVLVGVVEEHAAALLGLVAPGGSLVISGALAPQVGRVVAAVRAAAGSAGRSANLRSASAQGEWRAVVFRVGHRSVKAV